MEWNIRSSHHQFGWRNQISTETNQSILKPIFVFNRNRLLWKTTFKKTCFLPSFLEDRPFVTVHTASSITLCPFLVQKYSVLKLIRIPLVKIMRLHVHQKVHLHTLKPCTKFDHHTCTSIGTGTKKVFL